MNKTYEELQDELHMCHERIAELEEREAALGAHVIEIMDARDSKRGDTLENMLAVLNGGPTPLDSLARRDAKVAYDAVYTATVILNSVEASEYLVKLRQQAEQC